LRSASRERDGSSASAASGVAARGGTAPTSGIAALAAGAADCWMSLSSGRYSRLPLF